MASAIRSPLLPYRVKSRVLFSACISALPGVIGYLLQPSRPFMAQLRNCSHHSSLSWRRIRAIVATRQLISRALLGFVGITSDLPYQLFVHSANTALVLRPVRQICELVRIRTDVIQFALCRVVFVYNRVISILPVAIAQHDISGCGIVCIVLTYRVVFPLIIAMIQPWEQRVAVPVFRTASTRYGYNCLYQIDMGRNAAAPLPARPSLRPRDDQRDPG